MLALMINKDTSPKGVRHLARLFLAVAIGLFVYTLLSQLSGMLTIHDYHPHPLVELRFLFTKVWIPWLLMSPLVWYIARRLPVTPGNWASRSTAHVFLLLGLSLIHASILSYHYHYFEHMNPGMETYEPWQHMGHFLFGDSLILFNMLIYITFITSFNLRNFYTEAQRQQLEASQLSQQLSESKLEALRMQINPHFLFNTLNVISVLTMKGDKDTATETVRRLSHFFRMTLDESDAQQVPLKKELHLLEHYLAIEQVRFGDRLALDIRCEPQLEAIPVPTMLLQPLAENAIRHGLSEQTGAARLSIRCTQHHDRLKIVVEDNGAGCEDKDLETGKGVGLRNVRQRLQQVYGTDYVLTLRGKPNEGVTITLSLPLNRSVKEDDV